MKNKHVGSNFEDHLFEDLRENDQLVFLHIKNALENPSLNAEDDYEYLIQAIKDVAIAKGITSIAGKAGITRQSLHKTLNGETIPSIKNIMAILKVLGLRFTIQQVEKTISDDEPATVLDVAEYANKKLPKNTTTMKLQKIVYYAQAESLIHYDRPLFNETIEAWEAGPVVKKLYKKHKGLRFSSHVKFGDSDKLSLEQKSCVDWAINKYGNLDGDTLSRLTHLEDPWKKAAKKGKSVEIKLTSIKKFYANLPDYTELDEST